MGTSPGRTLNLLTILFLAALLPSLLITGCMDRIDYDIEEVATEEYLRGTDADSQAPEVVADEADLYRMYDQTFLCVSGETEDGDDIEDGGHLHEHGSGQRNHGTEWFFNQPWAATFIWPKMIRDTVILILLAAAVLTVSRLLGRRRG